MDQRLCIGGVGALVGTLVFFGLILWIPEILSVRALWPSQADEPLTDSVPKPS